MISHRYRCIFIHQRKAAGCSIMASFGFNPDEPEWHLFNDGTLSKEWARRDEVAPGYVVFAVVRNPWDRFVSAWKYLKATRDRPLVEVLRELPQTGHDYRHLTRPQMATLVDAGGVFSPDYVLRFEHIEQDYARFCDIVGKQDKALPRLNATRHKGYQEYFDAVSTDLFKRKFAMDVEFLGYDYSGRADHLKLKEKIPA